MGLDLHPTLMLRVAEDETKRIRVRELRLDASAVPMPITAADLREIPLARIEALLNSLMPWSEGDTLSDEDSTAVEFRLPEGGPTAGLTDDFLRSVARAYAAALQRDESPNVAMAEQTGYPRKSVQRWVYTARQRGLMPRGSKGRPG